MFRSLVLLAGAVLTAGACTPSYARPLVDVAVIDRDNGDWLQNWSHRGQQWIAGTPGHRYSVRLTNSSDRRVLVVLSVDGVNAVSGQTASPSQAGYVLEAWQSTEINGWRKSMDDVAQFVFTDLPDSYAARTGRPDNVGVIGVAVFQERQIYRPVYEQPRPYPSPYPYPPYARGERESDASSAKAERRAGNAAPAPAGAAREQNMTADSAAAQSIGTGHGAREWSPVSQTQFVRASRSPAQVIQLRYDDYANLVARGVVPRYRDPYYSRNVEPRAFPNGFVADPPSRGW
ncbi:MULTISPECIES: hypothetical protein [unclassified Lysobacter]|uniref:hypothetical protein n=1 Tax=unclassified Lysobacter TaxID=2635362 RepID=UPI001BEB9D30|nr:MULTISPECIES: hypothetical protein [unclassified Lysobacter]MBT2745636.1 hypothetical protein [Lysobacter sp. ISL-42]MBT2753575.1 hypothetical protein [Lysobacter sp. ISL-50]MBT2777041.1 hypothetical protein [Lysobacter sp. ISL-54]MBT2780333.1 hypothetical protein [Lysobacter sp. ISL-52]